MKASDEQEFYRAIGERLHSRRALQGLSLTQLGQKAGVSPSVIRNCELTQAHIGTLTLVRLARALRVSPSYLLEGQNATADNYHRQIQAELSKLFMEDLSLSTAVALQRVGRIVDSVFSGGS